MAQASLRSRLAAAAAWAAVAPACHVMVQSETLRTVSTERIVHPEGAIARRAALVLGDAGRLRFVEPLECPTEEILHQRATIERATRPNLATLTVGVIAAATGGVLLTTGLLSSRPAGSAYTYLGAAGVGAGLPMAIGPWLGARVEVRDGEPATLRQPGPSQPCGDRPLAARAATLEVSGIEVHGAIERDGAFAVSPYQWIDAFRAADAQAAEITATVEGGGGPRTMTAVLDVRWLAAHAADFLGHVDGGAEIQPLRKVPGLVAGPLRASLSDGEHPVVRIALALRNDGPGDAWAVRGQVTAPGAPAIDGRMIYVGKLARGAQVSREVTIPVTGPAAAALRGRRVELSIELRDGHDTAPTTPVRFAGVLDRVPGGP